MFSLVTAVISAAVVELVGDKKETLIATLERAAKVVCVQPTQHMWILQGDWENVKRSYAIIEEFCHRVHASDTVQHVLASAPGDEYGPCDTRHGDDPQVKFASPDSTATKVYQETTAEQAARTALQQIEAMSSSLGMVNRMKSQESEEEEEDDDSPEPGMENRMHYLHGSDTTEVISVSSEANDTMETSNFEPPPVLSSTTASPDPAFDTIRMRSRAELYVEAQENFDRSMPVLSPLVATQHMIAADHTGSNHIPVPTPAVSAGPGMMSPPDRKPDMLTITTTSAPGRHLWPPLLSYASAAVTYGSATTGPATPQHNTGSAVRYPSTLLAIQQEIKQEPGAVGNTVAGSRADSYREEIQRGHYTVASQPNQPPPTPPGSIPNTNLVDEANIALITTSSESTGGQKASPEYKCPVCGKTYRTMLRIREHIRTHNKDYVPVYHSCPKCGKSFTYRHNMIVHLRRFHFGVQPIKRHSCRVCGMKFVKPYMLRDHEMKAHQRDPPVSLKHYPCTQCTAVYSNKYALAGHCSKAHKLHISGEDCSV